MDIFLYFFLEIFKIVKIRDSSFVALLILRHFISTSKTPYVAIDERGLVRSIHLFLFSCVH